MLTLIHLSDIHFRDRDHLTQFDLDQPIRRALLEDIEKHPANSGNYDALLLTGDVAFSGRKEEYERAQEFLSDIFVRGGVPPESTFCVPGNHDVDRAYVEPDLPLWAAHQALREAQDPVVWRDHLYKQLVKDPQHSLLAPLKAYNDFAQGYGCFSGMVSSKKAGEAAKPQLSWHRTFKTALEDGTLVRFNGLNSALISDAGDAPGKLLVSEFQTTELQYTPKVVDVVLCHHPPEWLMDKTAIRNVIRTFAPLSLFGHEHSTRISADKRQIQLFAGAVQPSRRDPDWLPTYHILELKIEISGEKRELVVRIHTREYTREAPSRFRPRRNELEQIVDEHRIELPEPPSNINSAAISVASSVAAEVRSGEVKYMPDEPQAPTPVEIARHELQVHFFLLRTPQRYQSAFRAGLLRDGDDALDPQIMWAEVFSRAESENKLADFWAAVAENTESMKHKENPFTHQTHA